MAYPDHSPRGPLMGPGSPPRAMNGPNSQLPPPAYAPRTMLPPSPSFPPRYSQAPSQPTTSPSPNLNHDSRAIQPPQTRPGSSMSILSMLGSDPERPQPPNHQRQQSSNHHPSSSATSMSLGAVMSPPQNPAKTSVGEYTYKPRSQTPDRIGFPGVYGGTRPYRSSSGTMMQRPSPSEDHLGSQSTRPPFSRPENHMPPAAEPMFGDRKPASTEHSRRSSINAILQPQDVQPQHSRQVSNAPPSHTFGRYGPEDNGHIENPSNANGNGNGAYGPESMTNGQQHTPQAIHLVTQQDGSRLAYDTRPPAFGQTPRHENITSQTVQNPFMSYNERASSQPVSPGTRRQTLFKNSNSTSGLSNGPPNPYTQAEQPSVGSQIMARQDSSQSQYDRNVLSDRARRRFSPFASSVTSQPFSSAPPEDRNRKGSDESSQHRAILGLAAESKRGRYSPLPQAVHGAQAQTPTPDSGIKDEHGRVFSGIGSGLNSNASGIATGPPGLSASPFKRDEGVARLSEDNLMKISRNTPSMSKRPRKMKDEEDGAEREDGRRITNNGRGGGKRSKYSHYNLNGEELTNALTFQRRNTPTSNGLNLSNIIRRTATPTAGPSTLGDSNMYRPQQPNPTPIPQPIVYKPHTTIKISAVIQAAARKPRRHLGFFLYSPKISISDNPNATNSRLGITIEPNLFPSFDKPENINCTYTLRVSRLWLRKAERQAICATRALWGSGIFTDDSDPVAAAIHSGFIKAAYDDSIDTALLETILKEQNPKIDGGLENVPDTPVEPPPGKDCQIKLVVLPTLESYGGSARYGIRSRSWLGKEDGEGGSVHDGVSFYVEDVRWVEDGSRGRERHAKRTPVQLKQAVLAAA